MTLPTQTGHFGPFGGKFVPETLMAALEELEREYAQARRDPRFRKELAGYLTLPVCVGAPEGSG